MNTTGTFKTYVYDIESVYDRRKGISSITSLDLTIFMLMGNNSHLETYDNDVMLEVSKVKAFVQGKDVTFILKERIRGNSIETSLEAKWQKGSSNTIYHNQVYHRKEVPNLSIAVMPLYKKIKPYANLENEELIAVLVEDNHYDFEKTNFYMYHSVTYGVVEHVKKFSFDRFCVDKPVLTANSLVTTCMEDGEINAFRY